MSFTPIIRNSNSIPKTLLEFSKDRKIDVKALDFELISHQTLIKRIDSDDYVLVEDIKSITNDDLKNEQTQIIQEYEIKIFPLHKSQENIQLSIAADKLKTKAIITIKENSTFIPSKSLARKIRDMIWYKKLRAGLFIGIFEKNLNAQIKRLVPQLPYEKPLHKDLKFTVAQGLAPIFPIHASVEKVHEELNQDSDSIISVVKEGALVLKYIKEKKGEDGRACNGKFIPVMDPRTNNLRPIINDTIEEKEYEDCIDYYARENGYVVFENNNLEISNTLKLSTANFKSTANIDAGELNKDISVHIGKNKSKNIDAIGSGVNIDVKELKVDGSVSSNVNIVAEDLDIGSQTHKNSRLEVENTANIKLHRGDLTAKEANVEVLESGKITAQRSIYVKQMVGGTAIAPIVKVDELISNSTIIASKHIEIKTILGFDNKLIIDPHAIESYHKDAQDIENEITSAKKSLEVETKLLEDKIQEHASRIKRIKTFQQRVIEAKKTGKQPLKQDIIRIKQYKKESDILNSKKDELKLKETEIETLEAKLFSIYNQDLEAKITSKTNYDGTSQVVFRDPNTREELVATPNGTHEVICLELNSDGEKVINIKG